MDAFAIHDIHLKFQVPGIWKLFSASGKSAFVADPISKDIPLPDFYSNGYIDWTLGYIIMI